tara:strand:- start:1963 stop:3591 length:1629 start_codon:yes stop_codon:yes gene_type:complete
MVLKNSINFISSFFIYIYSLFRKIYLNSAIYNKKISRFNNTVLNYKPSLSLLGCIIKYEKKRKKIEDFYLNSIWKNDQLKEKDFKKLHSFFWLFSLDLKSSKKITQSIILNWIEDNQKYNQKSWEVDVLSKRIISWISNSQLTYNDADEEYKSKFNFIINKQINHLINEISRSELVDDKMIGSTAIILTGLSYNDEKILNIGINLLKKISSYSFDSTGFPKSRSIRQLIFYLKYFVLIRELLKESQKEIPEHINENIYYLGQAYNFLWQSTKVNFLFNGNHDASHSGFDDYLKNQGYKFKNQLNEFGGYTILKNKKTKLAMDIGSSPDKKFSNNYQSGPLSFEIYYNGIKLITNSGYFQNNKHQLNYISRSSAAHSTLILDNNSVSRFKKNASGISQIEKGFRIIKKNIVSEDFFWSISGSHDGYQKKYGIVHERTIEYYHDKNKFIGLDKLIKKKNFKHTNFEIRFHLMPNTKLTKTQDGKSILIELENSGWRFICKDHKVDVETGLYFGNKNSFTENQNIFITGVCQKSDQEIPWEICKI